jgi:hypothetical protein
MAAALAIPDGHGGRAGPLAAGWLATKRSPHTRAAYLRDLAQWADRLAVHGVPLLETAELLATKRTWRLLG